MWWLYSPNVITKHVCCYYHPFIIDELIAFYINTKSYFIVFVVLVMANTFASVVLPHAHHLWDWVHLLCIVV